MWPHELLLDPFWQRLATALLHFVWQGALVAALYAIAVEWLGQRAELRYSLGVVALVAMAACPAITFAVANPPSIAANDGGDQLYSGTNQSRGMDVSSDASVVALGDDTAAINVLLNHSTGPHASDSAVHVATEVRSGGQQAQAAVNVASAWQQQARIWVALVWLVGVLVCSVRLLIGAIGLRRITACVTQAGEEHRRLLERLARTMSLRRVPRLVVSRRVRQAIATGFLHPIIVMPAAWLAELPPSVIEAVLAHELAHIRRCDLWVNLLQRAVEALLFFHPAVWWLSRQLRSDRELCCDELAVAATRRRVEYVSALEVVARRAACERDFSLATGIGGRKMQLLERVRHVLGLPATPRGRAWWPAGILALAVPCMLWVLSGPARPALADDEEREVNRERDEDRDREDREGDREEREVRRPESRDEEGSRRDEEREVEVEIEFRNDKLIRDKRASAEREEAERREKQRDQEIRADRARMDIQRARAELERRVAEAHETIAREVRAAEKEGDKERVQALHEKLEAVRRQAQEEMHALEKKFRSVAEELGRSSDKQRAVAEEKMQQARAMVEKVEHELRSRGREFEEQMRAAEKAGDKAAIEKLRAAMEQLKAEAAMVRQKVKKQVGGEVDKQRMVAEVQVREAREMAEKIERNLIEQQRAIKEKMQIAQKEGDKAAIEKLHAAMKQMEAEAAAVREKIKKQAGEKIKDPLVAKVQLDFTDKKPIKPRSPEADRELMEMVRELRQEVQQLRREVRELRDRGERGERRPTLEFREDRGDKKPQTSVLREIPYVGRLFENDEREEVELRFDSADIRPKQIIELETEIEDIKKLADDEAVKLQTIDVEVELNDSDLKKVEDVQIELENRDLENVKAIELKKRDLEKLNKIELKNRELDRHKVMDIKNELDLKNRELQEKLKQLDSLRNNAASDVEIRYAQKAAEIAKKEWDRAAEANKKTPGSITAIDLHLLKLAHERTLLEIERAKNKSESELRTVLDARKDIESKINKLNEVVKETANKLGVDGGNKPNPPPEQPNKENPEKPKP